MRRTWIRGAAGLAGGMVEITDRCRFGLDGKENAEEGSVALWTLYIDDPLGDFEPGNHRFVAIEEDEAEDPEDRFILCGYTGDPVITRGPYRTGSGRVWAVPIADVNVHLNRRVLVGSDNDRPVESDVERVTWLVDTVEASNLDGDTRYLSTDNPVELDANDFTTQDFLAVISDASRASKKNYFVTYFGDNGPDDGYPWGFFSLFYDLPGGDAYQSTHRISNIISEVDQETTFFMGLDDDLLIDGSRIYSTVVIAYDGGVVSASREATAIETAIRDTVMQEYNVKSSAKASARATATVNDLATPEHRSTVHVIVPRAKVNAFRPGMAIQVKVSHWPEPYRSEWTWMRALNRQVLELSEGDEATYLLTMDLSRSGVPAPAPVDDALGILYQPRDNEDGTGDVLFGSDGDNPGSGYPSEPLTGGLSYAGSLGARTGFTCTADSVWTIDFVCSATGAYVGITVATARILVDGVTVAEQIQSADGAAINPGNPGFPYGFSPTFDLTAPDIEVENGDVIEAFLQVVNNGTPVTPTVPIGSGNLAEHLRVRAGSLAP